jgi:hypothetical protein
MKSSRGKIEDQTAIDLGIEAKVKVVERAIGIAEAGLFAPALQQAVCAARELVRDQARDQIDRSHGFGLRLAQPGFEHSCHAAQS